MEGFNGAGVYAERFEELCSGCLAELIKATDLKGFYRVALPFREGMDKVLGKIDAEIDQLLYNGVSDGPVYVRLRDLSQVVYSYMDYVDKVIAATERPGAGRADGGLKGITLAQGITAICASEPVVSP